MKFLVAVIVSLIAGDSAHAESTNSLKGYKLTCNMQLQGVAEAGVPGLVHIGATEGNELVSELWSDNRHGKNKLGVRGTFKLDQPTEIFLIIEINGNKIITKAPLINTVSLHDGRVLSFANTLSIIDDNGKATSIGCTVEKARQRKK